MLPFAVAGTGVVMIWHFGCDFADKDLLLILQITASKRGEYNNCFND